MLNLLKKGKNWISSKLMWEPIKQMPTKKKALMAQEMRSEGESVKAIALHMGLSKSRIYEYLKQVRMRITIMPNGNTISTSCKLAHKNMEEFKEDMRRLDALTLRKKSI